MTRFYSWKTKKAVATIIGLLFFLSGFAQSSLSFYHMQNGMPQSANYNAAFFPDAKVFISLPAISGVDISLNNSFRLKDVFTQTGDSSLLDIDRFLAEQHTTPYLNMGLGVTDFMIGFRVGDKSHLSLFVNDRLDAKIYYPIDLLRFIWHGNLPHVGKDYLAEDFFYDVTAYREWGAGYARELYLGGFRTTIGVRLKFLTGLLHSSTEDQLSLSVYTSAKDYSIKTTFHDATIRSAGLSLLTGTRTHDPSYFLANDNNGFGLDLGATMNINDHLSLGLAVNDLGMIRWKEYAEYVRLDGTSFNYEGINPGNFLRAATTLMDSLRSIRLDTTTSSFQTSLNMNALLNASYRITDHGYAQTSIDGYLSGEQIIPAFGLGYLQHVGSWLSASTTAHFNPHGFDVGTGLMLRGGFFQFYAVAENLLNTINISGSQSLNLKFGINFLFGRSSEKVVESQFDHSLLEYEKQLRKTL